MKHWLINYSIKNASGRVKEGEVTLEAENITIALGMALENIRKPMLNDPEITDVVIWNVGIIEEDCKQKEKELSAQREQILDYLKVLRQIDRIVSAREEGKLQVLYLCDGNKEDCRKSACYKNPDRKKDSPICYYTSNVQNALNFKQLSHGRAHCEDIRIEGVDPDDVWLQGEKEKEVLEKLEQLARKEGD